MLRRSLQSSTVFRHQVKKAFLSSRFFSSSAPTSSVGVETDHDEHAAAPPSLVQVPSLNTVPSLPVFGSTISAYSGAPTPDLENTVDWWRKMCKTYGPFFSFGLPGLGVGWLSKVYVVQDPQEMLKVLKKEGAYPSGIIQEEWPFISWMEHRRYKIKGFFGRDEEWKRLRTFMQKDLLAPQSARSYLPGILKGAAKASPKAQQFAQEGKLNRYLNFAGMDMFSQVLFGGDEGMSKEDYNAFCNAGVDGLGEVFKLLRDPLEVVAHKIGLTTPRVKRCHANMDIVDEIGHRRLEAFLEHMEKGDLTEEERNSYFYKIMQRHVESNVTLEEAIEICVLLMLAAVDTTAGKAGWNVLQLALNQDFQEELYQQIDTAVQKEGGLTASIFDRSEVPLLPALVRETHRCTPAAALDIMKKVAAPTEVHGVTLPTGSCILFDPLTAQMDPDLVEDPLEFKPQRWLKEAVEARKNTPSAIIDHPFYSGPFSQGVRRCPGSRVANLEVQAIIAQLLLDWKIEGPSTTHWKDVKSSFETVVVPQFPEGVQFVPRT